jgi:hypothetical protein
MTRPLFAAISLLIFCFYALPSNAETDVISYINAELAAKNVLVNKNRTVEYTHVECYFVGLNGRPHRECNEVTSTRVEKYTDLARITSVNIISIQPIKWDNAQIKTIPATALIQRLSYANCGQDPYSTNETLQVKGAHSNSVSKTHSLSIKTSVGLKNSFSAGNGLFGGQTEISVGIDVTTSDSTTNSEQFSNEETRTWGVSISPQPGHAGFLQILAIQQSIEVPFSTTIVVDGNMEPNASGVSKVSQLLNETERTLPFDGSVKATQLSDAYTGNFRPDTELNCEDPTYKGRDFVSDKANLTVPLSSLGKEYAAAYTTFQKAYEANIAAVVALPATHTAVPTTDEPTGQAIYSSEVVVSDPKCGFDNYGQPKLAIHLSELGQYTKFEKGVLQHAWDEWSDQFKSCVAN